MQASGQTSWQPVLAAQIFFTATGYKRAHWRYNPSATSAMKLL
jgi:hypothetical protein